MARKSRQSISNDSFQEILSNIYNASLDPSLWETTLASITQALGGEQSIMRLINSENRRVSLDVNINKDPSWNQLYREHYIHCDFWVDVFLNAPKSFSVLTHEYISDREYEKQEIHADFLQPQNAYYGLGTISSISPQKQVYLTLHRDKKQEGFENQHLKSLELFLPHIKRALLINEKIGQLDIKSQLLQDVIDQSNNAILLVNSDSEILFVNKQAEELIRGHQQITIHNKRLKLLNIKDNESLAKLIFLATGSFNKSTYRSGGAMNSLHAIDQTKLYILVNPVNPEIVNYHSNMADCAMVVLASSQCDQKYSLDLLQGLYDLSPSEAHLVKGLCQGFSLEDLAQMYSLSRNTLKTQLRSCFYKTGVNRQQDLIKLVISGPSINLK